MARDKGTITHQGNTLSFFPDSTATVQAARREFGAVKKALQADGVPYAMLYPARLRIGPEGNVKIFNNPKSPMDHAKKLKKKKRATSTLSDPDE